MKKDKTSIVFTGDIGFDRYMDRKWEDENLLSQSVLDFFHSADHVCANVEGALIDAIQQELADLPPITVFDAEAPTWDPETEAATPDATTIRRDDSGAFVCEGKWLEKLVNQTNLDDRESLMYFQRMLQTGGIIDMLREAGCDEGHTVKMFGIEFDFVN